MLRLVRFVTRAPAISPDYFDRFRRDELGPFVAGAQTRLNLLRYVQTHRDQASAEAERAFLAVRDGADNRFDGLEEYWWPSERACFDALADPDGPWREITRLGEEWFNSGSSPAWLAVDYPQVSTSAGRMAAAPKSGLFRLAFAITPGSALTLEAAQRYWLIQHGPLIRGFAVARGTLAYSQVHRLATPHDLGFAPGGPHMGHAEAWFSQTASSPGPDGLAAIQAALADEQAFIDWSQSSVLVGKELVFVDRSWM